MRFSLVLGHIFRFWALNRARVGDTDLSKTHGSKPPSPPATRKVYLPNVSSLSLVFEDKAVSSTVHPSPASSVSNTHHTATPSVSASAPYHAPSSSSSPPSPCSPSSSFSSAPSSASSSLPPSFSP